MDPIEEIKDRLNIVDVIGEYVKLQKVGRNWRGLCPFHREKTPSFYVSEEKQLFHCFGCGASGNIFNFIMKIENLTFPEALRILANKAGVKLRDFSPQERTEREKIYKINELATNFFIRNLFSQKNKEVLDYLKKRGLSEKTIREFKLGFAPDSWHSLENYLKNAGFSLEEIKKSGLLSESKGKFFDRFRRRVIFPFFDFSGKIVGFSGRIFGQDIEGTGKYVNTPETPVFIKSHLIYGFYHSKKYIKEEDKILVVEGQMDFLNAWEKNIRFAVATSGTAFGFSQLKTLSRFSKNLILSFDMDEAGQRATERIVPQALSLGFKIKILELKRGKDLADFLKGATKKEIENLFENSLPVMDFYFQRALSLADKKTIEGKEKIAGFFIKKIKNLKSPIEQGYWLEKLSEELGVKEEYLLSLLKQTKKEKATFGEEEKIEKEEKEKFFLPRNRWEVLSEKILSLILIDKKKLLPIFEKKIEKTSFLPEKIALAINYLKKPKAEKNEELENYLTFLELRNDYLTSKESGKNFDFQKELEESIFQLKKEFFKKEIEELGLKLKEAEKEGEKELIEKLTKKLNRTIKEAREFNV